MTKIFFSSYKYKILTFPPPPPPPLPLHCQLRFQRTLAHRRTLRNKICEKLWIIWGTRTWQGWKTLNYMKDSRASKNKILYERQGHDKDCEEDEKLWVKWKYTLAHRRTLSNKIWNVWCQKVWKYRGSEEWTEANRDKCNYRTSWDWINATRKPTSWKIGLIKLWRSNEQLLWKTRTWQGWKTLNFIKDKDMTRIVWENQLELDRCSYKEINQMEY